MATARDGCVVETAPLSDMLRGFVQRWKADRPATGGTGARVPTGPGFVQPIAWLAEATGLPARTIDNIVRGRTRTTELRVADPLVQAINVPEAWHDGTLEIMPNPKATVAARATCCSGSLTGSAAVFARIESRYSRR